MRTTGTIQSRESPRDKFPIVFKNNTSETIPPHAIMEVESVSGVNVDAAQLVVVKKPTGGDNEYIINGPLSVAAGKKGRGRIASPVVIRFTGTTPALGDEVGPSASAWTVSTSGTGYKVLGGAEDGVVLCRVASGGTTIRTARVTTTITAATGPTTWGSGQAQLCHATTGSPTGSSIDVDNEWPEQFVEDSMVKLDMGYSPPRVLGGTCTALDASTFWGDA